MPKTPGLNLPFGIDPVNPVPVDANYGPYVSLAEAKTSVPQALRYDGLTVNVIGSGEYWWTTDLTDTGLISKGSSGAFNLPIERYVYLVQDASDAVRMGGVTNNVYGGATGFQDAYDAANALQISLGTSYTIVVVCGNIHSSPSAVGDLTLTANFNGRVKFVGNGMNQTILGNIIATNASGNGFAVGLSSLLPATFINMNVGTISTHATGTTGNSGNITLFGYNTRFGNLDAQITNALNTTGNGGNVGLTTNQNSNIIGGNINTFAVGSGATAGFITILARNSVFTAITGATNNQCIANSILLANVQCSSVTSEGTQNAPSINIDNCVIGNCVFSRTTHVSGSIIISNNQIDRLTTNNTHATQYLLKISQSKIGRLITDENVQVIAEDVVLVGTGALSTIVNLGNNSVLSGCVVSNQLNTTLPVINGIGTGCVLNNTNILDGSRSISNNGIVVTLSAIGCYFERRTESIIKIWTTLTAGAIIDWDVQKYNNAVLTITGTNQILNIIGLVENGRYRLRVTKTNAGDTLLMPDGTLVYNNGAGIVTLSGATGKKDDLIFEYINGELTVQTLLDATSNGSIENEDLLFNSTGGKGEPFGLDGDFGFPIQNIPLNWIDSTTQIDIFVYADSDIIPFCTVPGSSSTSFLVFANANVDTETLDTKAISTIGYTGIKLYWNSYRMAGTPPTDLQYSTNGTSWTSIPFTDVVDDDNWYAVPVVNLPVGAENQPTLYLRWEIVTDGSNLFTAFDDIKLTGKP